MRKPIKVKVYATEETLENYGKDLSGLAHATEGSAGFDLYATKDVTIMAGGVKIVPLGLFTEFSKEYVAELFIRSGSAFKEGLSLANGTGIIDSDYRKEWGAIVRSDRYTVIKANTRICQVLFKDVPTVEFTLVGSIEELNQLERDGGFGHTGIDKIG